MSIARGEPPQTAEVRYSTELDREAVELVAELVDEAVHLSPNDRSARLAENILSHWCEVETITLPATYESRLVLNFIARRMLLRHDMIAAGEDAGDVYRIIIEQGMFRNGFQPLSERSLLMYIPEDETAEPVALQTYALSPLGSEEEAKDYTPTEQEGHNSQPDFNELIRFTKQVNHDFYSWNRLSTFELEDIFDEISIIHTALIKGRPYDAAGGEY